MSNKQKIEKMKCSFLKLTKMNQQYMLGLVEGIIIANVVCIHKKGIKKMFDREKAMKVWEEKFGDVTRAKDETGLTIMRTAYEDTHSKFGWIIQHKISKNDGGTDEINNLKIVHVLVLDDIQGK
ncbi:MAG: hypothetical protein FWB86_01620 [Treponema sp.]|nr:hypothetical protein [Treponema sp.]MCL2250818.1 hypothetical protein [Treponema sp.]